MWVGINFDGLTMEKGSDIIALSNFEGPSVTDYTSLGFTYPAVDDIQNVNLLAWKALNSSHTQIIVERPLAPKDANAYQI